VDGFSGTKNFTVQINDPGNPIGAVDMETYQLRVLDRKTLFLVSPASVTQSPQNHQLQFSVFAEGGAPGSANTVDTSSVPYYDYAWTVTPVGNAPALDASYAIGTITPSNPAPQSTFITFEQSDGSPAIGTYDITFQARDCLRRGHSTDPDYEFTPATVRIKVISPGGRTLERETGGKMKLRQEQFR